MHALMGLRRDITCKRTFLDNTEQLAQRVWLKARFQKVYAGNGACSSWPEAPKYPLADSLVLPGI